MDNSIITARDIQTVTAEINVIRSNVQQVALNGAIEIGRRLVEAKGMLPHGEWTAWLERDAQFSVRQAQRFMKLFEEYGGSQQSLFGGNTTSVADLPYTKALKLLVIPEEEREEFIEENHVQDISNAELDRLIKERDAAKAAAAKAEEDRSKLMSSVDKVMKDSEAAAEDLKKARKTAEAAEAAAEKAAAEAEKAAQAEKAARDKLAAKEQELAELRAHPEVPEAKLEEIRAEAEKAAAEEARKRQERASEEMKEAAERAEKEAERAKAEATAAQEKLEAVQKQLKMANPDVAVFSALFTQLQESYNKLHGAYLKVAANDTATAEKLKTAKNAYLAKLMKEEW